MQIEFETSVLGGLPVTVAAEFYGRNLNEWWITEVAGRPVKANAPQWIYRKLTRDDRAEIVEEAYQQKEFN